MLPWCLVLAPLATRLSFRQKIAAHARYLLVKNGETCDSGLAQGLVRDKSRVVVSCRLPVVLYVGVVNINGSTGMPYRLTVLLKRVAPAQ